MPGRARTARQADKDSEDRAGRQGGEARRIDLSLGERLESQRSIERLLPRHGMAGPEMVQLLVGEEIEPVNASSQVLASPDGGGFAPGHLTSERKLAGQTLVPGRLVAGHRPENRSRFARVGLTGSARAPDGGRPGELGAKHLVSSSDLPSRITERRHYQSLGSACGMPRAVR